MTLAEKHKIKAEEKKLEKEEARAKFRLNQIKPTTNACFNILFVLLSFVCLFPVFYVFMISVSSTDSITKYGYRLFPDTYSTAAYTFLWNERGTIFNSLIISVVVTVMGTVLGVLLTTMIGYVLSRPNYKLKGFFTWMVFIPMIFNGGMVANYVVVANMLRLNNTIWCLILPLAMSSFNVIICKTFFRTTVPDSIIESAKIDGCGNLRFIFRILLPLTKSAIGAMAVYTFINAWNMYMWPLLVTGSNEMRTVQIGISMLNSVDAQSITLMIAGVVMIILPSISIFILGQKQLIRGMFSGAVKG